MCDGARGKKISEDRLLKEKERKERKSSGKSLRFCTPVADGRTDGHMYVRTDIRICAGTCNGRGIYQRSTLSLNGRKKVAEVDGGAALVDRNRRTRRGLVNFYWA